MSSGGSGLLGPDPVRNNWRVNFFGKDNVTKRYSGYIYPSLDASVSVFDSAYLSGVMPCWTKESDGKHLRPSYWGLVLAVYSFFGPDKLHFMAPESRRKMMGSDSLTLNDTADPIADIRKLLHSKLSKDEFERYTKKRYVPGATDNEDAPLPNRQLRYALLVHGKNAKDNNYHDEVLFITTTAYHYLVAQAREVNMLGNGEVADEHYPQYTFGDFTKPSGAMRFQCQQVAIDQSNASKMVNCLMLSENGSTLDSDWKSKTMKFTPDMLAKRFAMWDPKNWHFLSYQEMVDIAVDQLHEVPLDFIKEACSHRANVPERKARAPKSAQAPHSDEEDDEEAAIMQQLRSRSQQQQNPASVRSAPLPPTPTPPAPTAPLAPTPPAAIEETIAAAGGVPFKVTVEDLLLGKFGNHYVLRDNKWVPVAEAYPTVPSVASVPVPPPPAAAHPPIPETAQSIPVAAGPPVAAFPSGVSAEDVLRVRESVIPNSVYEKQSAENKALCDEVFAAVARRKSTGEIPSPEESKALSDLLTKLEY